MKKMAFLLVVAGISSVASAAQPKSVPSIKDPAVSAVFARAYFAGYLAKPINMTPLSQMPAFQSLERAQQKLDFQSEQLRQALAAASDDRRQF